MSNMSELVAPIVQEEYEEQVNEVEVEQNVPTISLAKRMKSYEHDSKILPYTAYVVRLDGHKFSTFTKGFQRPFDKHFTDAMVLTLNDLVDFSNASTGFCCSDEISLIFPAICTKEEYEKNDKICHSFGGRVIKQNTIFASRCSVLFNNNIRCIFSQLDEASKLLYTNSFLEKIANCTCLFDSRVVHIPYEKEFECANNLLWRSVYDCHKNAVSSHARNCFGHKAILDKNSLQMIDMMKQNNLVWDDVPLYFRYGVYAKKDLVTMVTTVDNKEVEFQRGKIFNKCFKITSSSDMISYLFSKYESSVDPGVERIDYDI